MTSMNTTDSNKVMDKALTSEWAQVRAGSRLADYVTLTKPGITVMVLVTTAVGFCLGTKGSPDTVSLVRLLIGTALVAGGASALNMWAERKLDAMMVRTQDRPLPAGRLDPREAFWMGLTLTVAGLALLALWVNPLTAMVALASAAVYLFAYTPMKRITTVCTLVGAVSGALPPVMGWAAARNSLGIEAAVLFAILFFWQLPHFLAIAWLYREDYARAGFPMLSVVDPEGASMARQMILQTLALILVSLGPVSVRLAGGQYFIWALALGVAFVGVELLFAFHRSQTRARWVFFASIVYLPVLLIVQLLDKKVAS